jgi:signal transduction histidine kinase
MRRWTIRARFLLLLLVLLLSVFGAITLLIVRQNTHTLKNNLIDQSKSFAALATQPIGDAYLLYKDSGTIHIQQQVQHFTDLDPNINQVEIIDSSGHVVFDNNPSDMIKVSSDQATAISANYLYDQQHNLTGIIQPYVESFGIHRYDVVYGISYQSVNSSIQAIVNFILGISAAILLVSLVIWYILINRLFLKPVTSMSQAALAISRGDLDRRIRLERKDEIGDLSQAVETMSNSLKADITKLKEVDKLKNEFMMITSHNLRTPLTIINSYLEEIGTLDPPKQLKGMLDIIAVNATRLGGFAEDVLTISTIEAGQNILRPEPAPIKPVLDTIVKEFSGLAKQKHLNFSSHIDTAATVNLSKAHFRSALWNLLDNAYKFTADGGHINLTARTVGNQVEIIVKDDGIGISQAELPHLFTKFHRGTDTMKYDYEGTGIGLYIAKLIIEQHHGHIDVQSIEGQGSSFRITLPVENTGPAESQPQQNSLHVQGNSDDRKGQESVQSAGQAKDVTGAGVGGSDAVGQDLAHENHQHHPEQDESDEPEQ